MLHKLRIAAVVGVTLLLTILYLKAKPELYQATSTVKLGYWPEEMLLVKHDLASQATGSFNTELEILRSKLIASRVIEQLDLLHYSAFLHQAIQPWFY
ncbi:MULTISPECIES: hypothetical protein [unclassified Agarivorans]|uniref:hypothetical protein n=1 Tax=unclassified Agarivorans TaxID=2636026 RepID=UPI003D7D0990